MDLSEFVRAQPAIADRLREAVMVGEPFRA
jgi:hypothetical protein